MYNRGAVDESSMSQVWLVCTPIQVGYINIRIVKGYQLQKNEGLHWVYQIPMLYLSLFSGC